MRCTHLDPAPSLFAWPDFLRAVFLGSLGLLPAFIGAQAAAQIARVPVDLQPGISAVGSRMSVDSDADLTAAVWVDEAQLQVLCAVSDGRGTAWSAPVRVDRSPHFGSVFPLTFMDSTAVAVSGQNIYVSWRELDLGGGSGVVLFARSVDGGANFGPEVVLDDGVTGTAKSPRSVMSVSPDPAGDHIYVLRLDSDPNFNSLPPRVVASHDSGVSFGAAVPVTTIPQSGFAPRDPDLRSDGLDVHVIWADDPNNPDSYELYYQRSSDGGLTWLDFDVLLSRGLNQLSQNSEARLHGNGNTLFASYVATSSVTASDELRYALSLDLGLNWVTGAVAATAPAGTDIIGPAPHVSRSENLILAWEDNRSGIPEVYTATFAIGGTGFSTPLSIWNQSGLGGAEARIESPSSAAEPDTVLIAFDGGGGITSGTGGLVPAFLSTDGGQSFGDPVELDVTADADADYVELAYNDLYDNYLALWRADSAVVEEVRSGGLRPQTSQANGVTSGGTAQFDFSGFAPAPNGSAKFVFVLAADSAGSFPLPLMDGRELGLTPDATFFLTLSSPTLFSGLLDASGSGSTPPIDILSPSGTVFFTAAVAIALGPVDLVEVTDVLPVVVQ